MNRLTIFGTVAALTAIWLYLNLKPNGRSLAKVTNWVKPDEAILKGCFPWSIYYLQSIEYRDASAVCRGNLRGSGNLAYEVVSENVKKTFGDRFLVLLKEEPSLNRLNYESDQSDYDLEQEEIRKYVFEIVPSFKPQIPFVQFAPRMEWLLWVSSVIIGLIPLSLFWVYGSNYGLSDKLLEIVLILGTVLVLREFARKWVALRYKVKISPPFFTPNLGGILWFKNYIPNRKALFDLAIAPNIVSLIIGMALVLGGMLQPKNLGIEFDFKVSILMHGLNQILPNTADALIHPVAYAGWWVLNLTALSLIPHSILDGGNILRSMVGLGKLAIASPIMRIVILGLGLVSQQWLIIAALELFLLNIDQSLLLDDVTELNLGRDLLGILILGIALIVILPVPEFLEII